MSASEFRIGTKGALIDFVISAFQFTLSNHGWFLISSAPLAPNLYFGFLSKSLISMFWSLGDAFNYFFITFGIYNGL
jgi:hypothetical protein